MKRRTIRIATLATPALTVGLILFLCTRLDNRGVTITSTGPLDIRLWGIRPDAGDAIYDPNGTKIAETLGLATRTPVVWKEDLCRRDLIFEVPDANGALFLRGLKVMVSDRENKQLRVSGVHSSSFYHKGRTLCWFQMAIPRTIVKSFLFGAWSKQVPIHRIDMNVWYYYGPPHEPICTFKGPFEVGRETTDETGLHKIFFLSASDTSRSGLVMVLRPGRQVDSYAKAVFYDAKGRRLVDAGRWSRADPNNPVVTYRLSGLLPRDIELITVGEEPFEMTVRNLSLHSPGSQYRTYADHLDKIAERLNPGSDPTRYRWPDYSIFEDLNGALKVIDLIRGGRIKNVCERFCNPRDIATLDVEQLQKLRTTVLRWTGAMDPEIFVSAIESGLRSGWPEFVDIALDILKEPHRHGYRAIDPARDVSATMYPFRGQLSDRQVQRVVEIIQRYTDDQVIDRLFHVIDRPRSRAQITALWNLANHDQPWLWARAISELHRQSLLEGKFDELSEKMKVRVFLIEGPRGFSDPNQIEPKASELLCTLLSGDLLTQHSSTFSMLLWRIPESVDRRAMTAVMIESLRHIEYRRKWSQGGTISRIITYLNLWHGLDIGGLGCDVRKQIPNLDKMDLEAIAAEAVEWYDTVHSTADPNAAQ